MLLATVQMNSGADKAANLAVAERLVRAAAAQGACFIGLPENFAFMGPDAQREANAEPTSGPILQRMEALARELCIYLLAGSILAVHPSQPRLTNTSVLFGPDGAKLGEYRKIHLFDVDLGPDDSYRESEAVVGGSEVVVADTSLGKVGLSVCYDLRFPELYRMHASKGAVLLTVPSAFTSLTGKDHWEVLLRARAIENQAYVLAPAQCGRHSDHRLTHGHAMIVDPWGLVIARASEGEGFALGEFRRPYLDEVRRRLPALAHRRLHRLG